MSAPLRSEEGERQQCDPHDHTTTMDEGGYFTLHQHDSQKEQGALGNPTEASFSPYRCIALADISLPSHTTLPSHTPWETEAHGGILHIGD